MVDLSWSTSINVYIDWCSTCIWYLVTKSS